MWKELTEQEKKHYEEMATRDKSRYEIVSFYVFSFFWDVYAFLLQEMRDYKAGGGGAGPAAPKKGRGAAAASTSAAQAQSVDDEPDDDEEEDEGDEDD